MDGLLSPDLQMSAALSGANSRREPSLRQVSGEAEAREVAEEFEAFFLSQMVEAMFAGVGEDNPFDGGAGERAFRGMLNEEYARVMAGSGGVGLADNLTAEILRYQEAGDTA
ncbi:rod-binding protein [Hyphobacterium marinum]|uniref:Rod-binding protein n=1 Tax=Hyphobacterium marinum TaxID=3116574 RepID=A0ABU7M019_9PROT|nr:rod-binding protein [Hyphobacterium sp. Y6023]MEE2567046.1 rod-binding protein [Hyphobacterium sp. Y6023]